LSLLLTVIIVSPCAAEEPSREFQLKAAYLYKFLLFTEWPQRDATSEAKKTIVIGILGESGFGDNAFEQVEGEITDDKKLLVKHFKEDAPADDLKQCDLLFVGSALRNKTKEIVNALRDSPVLTVGDTRGFIESGGMINLFTSSGTLKFDINKSAAERVGIRFRSKLLRVAVRIVED
jgi:hypothetical protein